MKVLQLGSYLRDSSAAVTGPPAGQTLAELTASKLLLRMDGIDLLLAFYLTNKPARGGLLKFAAIGVVVSSPSNKSIRAY